jgi:hypothetical protein
MKPERPTEQRLDISQKAPDPMPLHQDQSWSLAGHPLRMMTLLLVDTGAQSEVLRPIQFENCGQDADGQSVTLDGLKWTKADACGLNNETFRFTL